MPRKSKNSRSDRTENKREFSRKCCFMVLIVILLSGILAVGLGFTIPAIIAKENRRKAEQYENRINKSLSPYFDNMDQTVNPCEDFYHYACGGFIKKWKDGTTKETVNALTNMREEIVKNTEAILKSDIKTNGRDYEIKVKSFYDSCVNEDLLNNLDKTPLTAILDDLGGWPIISRSNWQPLTSNWMDFTFLMHQKRLVADYLIGISVVPDVFDESSYIVLLNQPAKLSLPLKAYEIGQIMSSYRQYLTNVAEFLGAPPNSLDTDVNELIKFETAVVNMTEKEITDTETTNGGYIKMSVTALKTEIPEIDWYEYFNKLLPYHVTPSQQVLIKGMKYFKKFAHFIWNVELRVVVNYLLWQVVSPSGMRYLYKDAANIQADFYSSIGTEIPKTTRSIMCADDANFFMYLAVDAMYVRKYVPQSLKPTVITFLDFIRKEFINVIDALQWMDEEAKEIARRKIVATKLSVTLPDKLYDDDAVDAYYKELHVRNDTLLRNVLNIKWFEKVQNFMLFKEQEQIEWTTYGPLLSPFAAYSIKNKLTISLLFLQGTYYDPNGLMITNFGGLGSVVGHELFHAIDRKGSLYNDKGISQMWWTNYTRASFENREDCIIKKYNEFVLPPYNVSVNGVKTAAENFADNAGLYVAFQAFSKWVKANGEEVVPRSLKSTFRQLFWISYANTFCSVQKPETVLKQIFFDIHSPNEYRITGAASNMQQFDADFECHSNSKMNLYIKCPIT